MVDLGPHMLDIALYLMDEPRVTSVSAVAYEELGRAVQRVGHRVLVHARSEERPPLLILLPCASILRDGRNGKMFIQDDE